MQFMIDQGNDGQFHWRLVGDDGADLAISAIGYASLQDARRAASDVQQGAGSATSVEG
jgi:uncharacterized protein YegP (UPF0339 family)